MCYDVSSKYRHDNAENTKRMKDIEAKKPNDFFLDKEWKTLREKNRINDIHISDYNIKIKMGVKF